MFHVEQFREYVLQPTLKAMDMYSESAENLLVGTALIESDLYHFKQIRGPALGFFQVEPMTYYWLIERVEKDRKRSNKILAHLSYMDYPECERLMSDIALSAVFARLKYWFHPKALPSKNDVDGMADHWGEIYNTLNQPEDKRRFVKLYHQYGF